MAERNFEDKAVKLREARDIYREGEAEGEGGGIGIVPGAPGVRRGSGRQLGEEVKEHSNVLRGLREEVQELRKVVSVLKGGLVEASEAFKEFNVSVSQLSRGVQGFYRGFGQVVREFKEFQSEFSQVSKKLKEDFGKLLEGIGGLGKLSERELTGSLGKLSGRLKERRLSIRKLSEVSYELGREYENVFRDVSEVGKVLREARIRGRARKGEEGRGAYDYGYGVRGGRGKKLGYGSGYGLWDVLTKEEIEKKLNVKEQLKGFVKQSVIGVIFGDVGGGGYGRYGRYGRRGAGELVGDIRSVGLAAMGPIGTFVGEWLSGLYEKWQERKELKKELEGQRKAQLESMGIRKVRRIEREEGGLVSELLDWAKEVLWGKKTGGVILSAVSEGDGRGREIQGRVGLGGVWGLLGGGKEGKINLSGVELVQERSAKIYADKLHIEAKQVSGIGGGGGILDMVTGVRGGLLGRLGRVGRWIGRRAGPIGLGLGAGLAFLGGFQEGGLVGGIFRGGGALLGGLGGAKLGALIGTAIAPGIGTAIGGVLGGMVGMFGGEKIADAVYSGMQRLIKDRDWVESLRSGFMGVMDRIGGFLKGVVEGVKGGVSAIGSGVRELGGKVLDVVKWVGESLGFVAREAEAGTIDMVKAAGVVAHTKGDIGGMSAGMYQFTRAEQLKFLSEYGYMKEFEGVRFGTPEWKRRWQEVAKRHGEAFAKAQQEFAVKEYFEPGAAVAERFGIDVSKSRALQEMVFARAIQHGVRGFRGVLGNVFRGVTPEQVKAMSPEEVITRVYDHLIANVDRYWAGSAPRVREGVKKRLMREKGLLLAIERQKKEVGKQVNLQRKLSKQVKELEGSVKEQIKVNKLVGVELVGVSKGAKELKDSMQDGAGGIEEFLRFKTVGELEAIATEYEEKAKKLEMLAKSQYMMTNVFDHEWQRRALKVSEELEAEAIMYREEARRVRRIIEEKRRKAEELKKKAEELRAEAERRRKKQMKQVETVEEKRQVGLLAGGYLDYEPGEKIYVFSGVFGDEVVTEGRVMDDVLVADQQEVARRVIEEGVRTNAEWLNNMMRVIEGLRGGERAGGERRVVMSGGDAFSKVPLFPEDMGLVMMMLGLV